MSRRNRGTLSFRARGITLVELMVMSVIASLLALTIMQGFSGINRGVLATRFKTLATELANDKMQTMKSASYFRLRVSSQTVIPAALAGISPPIRSDTTNYPPIATTVRGVPFTFHTVVERVQRNDVSDDLEVINWDSPDTGLKKLTIDVVWQEQNSWKRLQLINLMENANRSTATGDFGGTVRDPSSALVKDVLIDLAESPTFSTLTDAAGSYRLGAPAGTYTLRASKRGYFSQSVPNSVIAGSSTLVTVHFTNFLAMSSGTIAGTVWQNDHLVISRICGKTAGSNHEYVEIFNPTTWTWTVDGAIGLKFQRTAAQDPAPVPISIDYTGGGNTIAPGGFYLFGCNPQLIIDGNLMVPDANWDNAVGGPNDTNFPYFDAASLDFNIIPTNPTGPGEGVGTITLYTIAGGNNDRHRGMARRRLIQPRRL
jgi:type II secretory pathway pseudopilin PulG